MRTVRAAVLAAALVSCLIGAPGASAATRPVYSDPVWWPIRAEVFVDCTMHNDGCGKHHTFWGVDVVPTGQRSFRPDMTSKAPVYAMGAGIAHIGEAHGRACGSGGSTNFGTWVWVDHGGGVISRYGHLSTISIKEGQAVTPHTALGIVGTTGKRGNCDVAYTDIMLRDPGILGPSVEFSTKGVGVGPSDGALFGCGANGQQVWPAAIVPGVSRWDLVPKPTFIPANTDACIPTTTSPAPAPPARVTLKKSASLALKATWAAPAGTARPDTVRVEVGEYHPSTKAWDAPHHERWKDVKPSTTRATFGKLVKGHKYRVRVWAHNSAGWSAASSWVTTTAS